MSEGSPTFEDQNTSYAGLGREFDIVIYGATGYSGELVVREMAKVLADTALAPKKADKLRWAIAGRNPAALATLEGSLRRMVQNRGYADHLPECCIVADTNDVESIKNMTKVCTVLVNCAGPYATCGDVVVSACLETSTHYVDITGEPGFLNTSIWPRHQQAVEKGVFLLPCCGFDCVPAEVGLFRVLEARRRTLYRVLTSPTSNDAASLVPVTPTSPGDGASAATDIAPCVVDTFVRFGGSLSNGTFFTLMNSIASATKAVAKKAGTAATTLPKLGRVKQSGPTWKAAAGWVMPLPSADPQLIARAYSVSHAAGKVGPLSTLAGYRHWLKLPHFFSWLKRLLLLTIFFRLAQTKIGAKFLTWYRGNGGSKKHPGPSIEERRHETATLTLRTSETDATLSAVKPFVGHVRTSHCYDHTASAASLAALCLLQSLKQRNSTTAKEHFAAAKESQEVPRKFEEGSSAAASAATANVATPPLPVGGAWTLASLFSKLPHTSMGVGLTPSLLDDFEARMRYHGAMQIEVEE